MLNEYNKINRIPITHKCLERKANIAIEEAYLIAQNRHTKEKKVKANINVVHVQRIARKIAIEENDLVQDQKTEGGVILGVFQRSVMKLNLGDGHHHDRSLNDRNILVIGLALDQDLGVVLNTARVVENIVKDPHPLSVETLLI